MPDTPDTPDTPSTEPDATGLQFTEAHESKEFLKAELDKKQLQLAQLTLESDPLERAHLQFDIAEIMLDSGGSGMPEAAWGLAKESFKIYMEADDYEAAVNCCDLLYRADLPGSVVALANGMWLAVTYPIDPEISIVMMHNLIDDTPAKSDGAAVAAVTAHYIADLRLEGEKRDSVMFLTMNSLVTYDQFFLFIGFVSAFVFVSCFFPFINKCVQFLFGFLVHFLTRFLVICSKIPDLMAGRSVFVSHALYFSAL